MKRIAATVDYKTDNTNHKLSDHFHEIVDKRMKDNT